MDSTFGAQGFDSKYQATERAAALIQPMIDQAAKAFDDLATTATKIQEDVKASVVVEVSRPLLHPTPHVASDPLVVIAFRGSTDSVSRAPSAHRSTSLCYTLKFAPI